MLGFEGRMESMAMIFWLLSVALLVPPTEGESARQFDPLRLGEPLSSSLCPVGIPRGICAARSGGFWVVSENPPRLYRLTTDGRWQHQDAPRGVLIEPISVSETEAGMLVIGERGGKVHLIDGGEGAGATVLDTLELPVAIADSPNSIVIADAHLDAIVTFAHGSPRESVFEFSDTPMRFPHGVAFTDDGSVWISDRGNHRLLRIDAEGEVLIHGDFGSAPGLLGAPMGLTAAGSGRVLVADCDNHRIQVIGPDGRALHSFGVHALVPREAGGRLHYPTDIALDWQAGIAAVIEPSERRVQLFGETDDEQGVDVVATWQRVDPVSHYGEHWALEPGGDLLAISEPDAERVVILDRSRKIPIILSEIGGPGVQAGRFRQPAGLAFIPGEQPPLLVVADGGNARLQIFRIDRERGAPPGYNPALASFVRSVDLGLLFAGPEVQGGRLRPIPGALTITAKGDIDVVDRGNDRVLRLDRQLRRRGDIDLSRLVSDPVGIATVGEDIIVTDHGSGRIVRLDSDGRIHSVVARDSSKRSGRERPWGIAPDGEGGYFVTDSGTDELVHIDENGIETILLKGPGNGVGQLFRPRGVTLDQDGGIWVLDHGNHRGVRIDRSTGETRWFGSGPYLPRPDSGDAQEES